MTTVLMLAALAAGQAGPYVPPEGAGWGGGASRAETRKEARDRALASAGKDALGLTKRYGDVAVQALLRCSGDTGKRLVELHESGDLAKVDAKAALAACARHGEPVAAWLAANHELLRDPVAMAVWAERPMDFAYELADLPQQARERRAAKDRAGVLAGLTQEDWQRIAVIGFGGFVLILVARAWLARRRPQGHAGPP